jgi:hypothetical protein
MKRPAPVKPGDLRPFAVGDHVALWFGGPRVTGKIVWIGVLEEEGAPYAAVDLGSTRFKDRKYYYPLWQLMPHGATRFSWRHVLYAVVRTLRRS